MKKILTGLQPTGAITLGNYMGAIKQMKELQDEYDSYIFVANMHAITVPQDINAGTETVLRAPAFTGVTFFMLESMHIEG